MLSMYVLVALFGCGHRPAPAPARESQASQLVPSDVLAPNMMLRQHLHGQYGKKDFELDCVLQVSDGKLTIVGLTPFGTRAFVLTQTGLTYSFEKLIDRPIPFDPVHILEDVHRVFFRGLPRGQSEYVSAVMGEERIEERWGHGVLLERTFERVDARPRGIIRVTFGGPPAPLVPAHVVIDNGWYGFKLEIDNVEQQSLTGRTP